ncbi:cell wall-binding repeat-containing protein [Peptostreptococcus porci]|uniref:cell wall-binding repeat-containing protein n=1 Tax=Peptostreptococcus porci TaxID=2652282 RepID=UPI002A90E726|nr:cell wall-binding repeat-containing protein [Peptostreptococcus porci]MDY6232901.1 cell wall-binding repeat-containing protein [Peptostreptococcus porci]
MKRLSAVMLTASMVATGIGSINSNAIEEKKSELIEISGNDRYETAVQISKHSYTGNAQNLVIASGQVFADALAGSTLASVLNAPLLLTNKDSVPSVVSNEISRLAPKNIYILGGINSVSSAVESRLKDSKTSVYRINGDDRYQTSLKIAEKVRELNSGIKKTIYVNGSNFPDALSAGGAGAKLKAPIILTNGRTLPSGTSSVSTPSDTSNNYIIGGPSSVNIAGLSAKRLYGSDRYSTSVEVAKEFFANNPFIAVASGVTYPDGLTSISLYNKYQMPILLSDRNNYPSSLSDFIKTNKVRSAVVVGGTNSISSSVKNSIKSDLASMVFSLKKPSLAKLIEQGDTTVRVKIDGEIKKPGKVEVYVANQKGEFTSTPTRTEIYKEQKDANASQEVTVTGFSAFDKDIKVKIRLKEDNSNDAVSDYLETTVLPTGNYSHDLFNKYDKNFVVEMTKSDAGYPDKILKKFKADFEEKIKNENYSVVYYDETHREIATGADFKDRSIRLKLTSKTNSADTYTDEFDFKVKYVTNHVTGVNVAFKNSEDSNIVVTGTSSKVVPIKVEITKSGVVPSDAMSLTSSNFSFKLGNSSTDKITVTDIAKDSLNSTADKAVYTANLNVNSNIGTGEAVVTVKAKDPNLSENANPSGELKLKIVGYQLTGIEVGNVKIGDKAIDSQKLVKNNDGSYTIKYSNTDFNDVVKTGISAELTPKFDGNGGNVAFTKGGVSVDGEGVDINTSAFEVKNDDANKKGTLVFKNVETNKDKKHTATVEIKCTDANSYSKTIKVNFEYDKTN